jgi:dimethylaniline monooxygenase (N-oxide forming)
MPILENGTVEPVSSIRKFIPGRTIELDDGTTISADAIIFCTGYRKNKSLSTVIQADKDLSLPRLYQNIFHPEYAVSLAYMTYWQLGTGVFEAADIMSMAIAQVFAGWYLLPAKAKMDHEINRHNNALRSLVNYVQDPIPLDGMEKWIEEGPWRTFLQSAAGTGVNEKLGYGWEGWKFWWSERELCNLLMTGVDSPHVQRLFEGRYGGRQKWSGALEAIKKANQEVSRFEEGTEGRDITLSI